jgi:hypothetical protein
MEFRKDFRDFDAVRDVGITIAAGLARVRAFAETVGAGEQRNVEPVVDGLGVEIPAWD